jgi:hypothetical protein
MHGFEISTEAAVTWKQNVKTNLLLCLLKGGMGCMTFLP